MIFVYYQISKYAVTCTSWVGLVCHIYIYYTNDNIQIIVDLVKTQPKPKPTKRAVSYRKKHHFSLSLNLTKIIT